MESHQELMGIKTIVSSKKSITKIGGYRKVSIPFTSELQRKYVDEDDGNFRIDNIYLEEIDTQDISLPPMEGTTSAEIFLMRRIQELEAQVSSITGLNLGDIERKFLLDKFNGNQEVQVWLTAFDQECSRYQISLDNKRVEALKYCIEGKVLEWYASNLKKLSPAD